MIVTLCLTGVIVSSLALREHYNTEIGIVGYALLAAIAERFTRITALGALAAMIFALRLTWIEWKILGTWCIYCVSSQGIITLVLACRRFA
jgi:uncharacterized membrane protein